MADQIKERPILFNDRMVNAILSGVKTQTRRIMKIQPPGDGYELATCVSHTGNRRAEGKQHWLLRKGHEIIDDRPEYFSCPFGAVGDRLWVRETFMHHPADYCWEASVSIPSRPAETVYRADHEGESGGAGWTPSIFMPRHLSRITLEITDIRVQRLQDISEEDCWAEGIEAVDGVFDGAIYDMARRLRCTFEDAKPTFACLWESIHGNRSWDENPMVRSVTFKRIKP